LGILGKLASLHALSHIRKEKHYAKKNNEMIEVLIKSRAGLHILKVAGNTKNTILDKRDNNKRMFCSL
jgi:hypothetical protein